ncbi:hypothetical protein C2845_PM13G00930 [Panicum miliaceum]|uniref:Disease resistance protein At4g27190-like leucine-rich repeats domain-containing protein n=1 Tax=Panicum miliaceum TaxID=4540 RepID=A0A3L6RKE4_PANMI|nr:hypothetical protein C2845_PM13G00930 [Panicum miliaceum]
MIGSSDEQHHDVPGLYDDVLSKVGGDSSIPMRAFPLPPTLQSDHHIEIGDGSHNVQSEVEASSDINLGGLLALHTESLHVHDALARTIIPAKVVVVLRWCRVERCPNLKAVFPSGAVEYNTLETVWASDLLKARCICSKGGRDGPYWLRQWRASGHSFQRLQHLHLRSCPSLQYALPVWFSSLPNLETLHIIHCGALRHVFEQGEEKEHRSSVVEFPKLATIHLYDLPALQQICEAAEMPAPALETIRIRGCWSLRRLPALKGRQPGMRRPAVEVEEVWDALEIDPTEVIKAAYSLSVHVCFSLIPDRFLLMACYAIRCMGQAGADPIRPSSPKQSPPGFFAPG